MKRQSFSALASTSAYFKRNLQKKNLSLTIHELPHPLKHQQAGFRRKPAQNHVIKCKKKKDLWVKGNIDSNKKSKQYINRHKKKAYTVCIWNYMEEPDLMLEYLKKRFGEVSAQASKTPLLSGKHYLFPLIIHWEMSCLLKVSVKLILITRGKAAILSCQPRQCPVPVSAAESLLSGATGSVWGKRQKTNGKCFFAAVEESPRSTTKKMLFQQGCCGSDVSRTYLT